ncbi:MAG: hypothetical protein LC122_12770 [Chitinophagales bacterium]|nr:hypothetical protein [Chitinophagales bacterium]
MKIERIEAKTCCRGSSIFLKLDLKIEKSWIEYLKTCGFTEYKNFTSAGILYLFSKELTIIGPFGSDRLQVKCKTNLCHESLNILENALAGLNEQKGSNK